MSVRPGWILVLGATGRQGGSTARELLDRGWEVHALVRDPHAPAARKLADHGAVLVHGDLDDPASLHNAMRGAHGVFSVQTFTTPEGVAGEERQGRSVADVAARERVAHVVYSSVGGAERSSGVPHFESKAAIERHIEALGLPATVLRPTMFIDNFASFGPALVEGELVLSLGLAPQTVLQMIATRDIAVFAADAFDDPEHWIGRKIEIAGDALTGAQMAEAFAEAAGTPGRFQEVPIEQLRTMNQEMAAMFDWFNREGYRADLAALREQHPDLTTLKSWLRETGWKASAR
ncbi:NmrA/HSCARG family protein [Streptacidiphilus sp. 4-A2]|nr:NmrA/HSCARG family protein [Streptacidiphilus sp. 4-A2]